jgi:Zn-finger nucleic acid-binding protein
MDAHRPGTFETYCPHCGHLYPSDAVECPRCPLTVDHSKGGRCPACAKTLVPEKMGDVTVDRCAACGGIWFDRGEVARVLDLHTQGVSGATLSELDRRFPSYRLTRERHRALACVRCRARMHRLPAAPRSSVYVEICGPHGIWFDRGEFERFREFVAAGGLEVARAREDAAEAATPAARASHPPPSPFYLQRGWPPESLTVLEVINHAAGPPPQARSWGSQPKWPR